jgi:sec-independent protein translocase protein TatA
MELGTPELLLILAIVILVFGVGRIGKIGSELGQGIRSFREGLHDSEKAKEPVPSKVGAAIPVSSPPANNDRTYDQ